MRAGGRERGPGSWGSRWAEADKGARQRGERYEARGGDGTHLLGSAWEARRPRSRAAAAQLRAAGGASRGYKRPEGAEGGPARFRKISGEESISRKSSKLGIPGNWKNQNFRCSTAAVVADVADGRSLREFSRVFPRVLGIYAFHADGSIERLRRIPLLKEPDSSE